MSKIVAIVGIHDSIESMPNDVELVAEKAKKFEAARHIVDTLASSKGGRVIGQVQGNEIIELPIESAEVLREIHERLQEEVGIKAEIGVGEDSHQAAEAIAYAKENAPGSIKVYSPDMTEESSESVKEPEVAVGPDDLMAKSEKPQYQAITPEDKQKIGQTLAMVQQNKELFDQMRQQSPEAYASVVGVIKALTDIIQYDKVAKEQAVVEMLEQINDQVRKEKAKKVKSHAKEINRHIKKQTKKISKDQEENSQAAFDKAHKQSKDDRINALNFAEENGHDDYLFLAKMLRAFRKK